MTSARAPRGAVTAGVAAGAAALAHFAPATLILPTFLGRPPASLGTWCRWRGSSGQSQVAITFDDGPSEETRTTLRLLDRFAMPATFFVLGEQLSRHPDIVKEIEAAGHEVATHGFAHTSALLTGPAQLRTDLRRAVELHRAVLGPSPRYYRPTYGHITATTLREVRRQKLDLILWSVWGKEFADPYPDSVRRRLEAGLTPGAIVLLHDNDVSCPPGTAAVTHQVLEGLRDLLDARGLEPVTLSDLLAPAVGPGATAPSMSAPRPDSGRTAAARAS